MIRVCFFGAYDPAYPRNRILREGLKRAGADVRECRVAEHRAFRRFPALLAAFPRAAWESDVLLVPEFRHKDVPLAHLLRGSRRLVFDPLISRHDTLVMDWARHAQGSPQARWNRMLDRWALTLPEQVLCDTWAHGELFESLGVRRERLRRVLVGAEDAFFAVPAPIPQEPVRLIYVGGFLPLHGVPIVLDALASLERRSGLPDFRCELVGKGMGFAAATRRAQDLGLERVAFPGALEYTDLPLALAQAHVVLGAFGPGAKAGRVIPHKVYQGVAAGRAVVTGDGPGVREVFTPGVHLRTVPRGEPELLADALAELIRDPDARARLGRQGREHALEVATVEQIGRTLLAALEGNP
ncbi:MAG TPA: glycosyltransferase [Candidatus Limnocylindria bacterium]|nr:glycosyltransferase [Candidatus Limnocylindria bacterium]